MIKKSDWLCDKQLKSKKSNEKFLNTLIFILIFILFFLNIDFFFSDNNVFINFNYLN